MINDTAKKTNSSGDFYIAESIQKAIRDFFDHFFDTRKTINEDIAILLPRSANFKDKIEKIRTELCIPNLEPKEDLKSRTITSLDGKEAEFVSYSWLEDEPKEIQKLFDKQLKKLMRDFNIPSYLYDWSKWWVLYGQPPFKPLYNIDFVLEELLLNTKEAVTKLKKYGLTTKEKKFLKSMIRLLLGVQKTGRTNKKKIKQYHKFLEYIKSSKSRKRGMKTRELALKTLELGQKVKHYEGDYKKTYDVIAVELYEDDNNLKQKKQRLRKSRERLKKILSGKGKKKHKK